MASVVPVSRTERLGMGKALREKGPRKSVATWRPPGDRADPVGIIEKSNTGRIPQLIPLRHGRMLQSPFTFYRGAALDTAADLRSAAGYDFAELAQAENGKPKLKESLLTLVYQRRTDEAFRRAFALYWRSLTPAVFRPAPPARCWRGDERPR